jgi:hypothetical protein
MEYWLAPVSSVGQLSAGARIQSLVGHERIFAFGDNTSARKRIRPGDAICFYAEGNGVVCDATVATKPFRRTDLAERYPWIVRLSDIKLYLDHPVVIDQDLRRKLDAFKERASGKRWQWFVVTSRKISRHDFVLLTRKHE